MSISPTAPLYLTRFIAAYLVLVLHYIPGSVMNAFPLFHLFGEPVNYFFFISGFVMMVSNKNCIDLAGKRISLNKRTFWIRRVARIYPMYILALAIVVLFHYTVREIDPSVAKKIWLESLGVGHWFFAASIHFPDWSVSCEFLFYLLSPFALIWVVKKSWSKLTAIVLVLFFVNIVFAVVYWHMMPRLFFLSSSALYKSFVEATYLHPIFKFAIFLFGCLCGRFYMGAPAGMTMIRKYNWAILLGSSPALLLLAGW